jgi:uroporphyrinogen-III synthase
MKAGIAVEEVVVYRTIEMTHTIPSTYDGILFFSPSAVNSFFAINKEEQTTYFAIGTTTANALQQYIHANVIVAERATKEDLVKQAISYFSKQKI